MERKLICLHFHIFKNAGTTIEWILKKNFSKNAVSIDTDTHDGILTYKKIFDYLEKNPDVNAISSHQIRFPIPKNTIYDFIPLLFIRHPIDRAFSIYSFQRRRTDANRPGIKKAKELNVNDYLKWSFNVKKFNPMKNFQVFFLSSKPYESDINESDLNAAMNNMKKCKLVGVVDRFDESLVLIEDTLKKYFSKIDLSYVKQNVSKEREENLMQRLDNSKSLLDKTVWERLLNDNMLDEKLYKDANEELDRRLDKINNFGEKLSNFRNRCERLQAFPKI